MSFLPAAAGKRMPSPCGSVGSPSPPSVPPPSPDTARNNQQFLRGGDGPAPNVQGTVEVMNEDPWDGSPACQNLSADGKVIRGNDLKGVLRIQDDEHHCDWAERRIRSLSMSILGLLFVLIAQGTILAIVVDRVYNPSIPGAAAVHVKADS